MKLGEVKKYFYTDYDVARAAGVSPQTLRAAKSRRFVDINDIHSITKYVMTHWLRKERSR